MEYVTVILRKGDYIFDKNGKHILENGIAKKVINKKHKILVHKDVYPSIYFSIIKQRKERKENLIHFGLPHLINYD